MARIYNMQVLDEQVAGLTEVSTSNDLNDTLGQADQIVIHIDATGVNGATDPTIDITVYHSADGRTWDIHTSRVTPAITGTTKAWITHTVDTAPLAGLVRIAVAFSTGFSSANGRIKLHTTGRTS